jgi:hypothetical protein
MTLLLATYAGEYLLHNGEFLLADANYRQCCCPTGAPTCCYCRNFPDSIQTKLRATVSGAFTGSGDLTQQSSEHCVLFGGLIMPNGDDCDLVSLDIGVWCPEDAKSVLGVRASASGGGADCAVLESGEQAPVSANCGPPFSATWHFHTNDIIPGGCPCGDNQLIVVDVVEI